MKKLFLSLFALSFAIAIFAQTPQPQRPQPRFMSPPVSNDRLYNLDGLEYAIDPSDRIAYVQSVPSNKEKTTVSIPGVIKVNSGKFAGQIFRVELASGAFRNCPNLTEVEFEKTLNPVTHKYAAVSSIPTAAFYNCPNLKKINLHFVNDIGANAFEYCRSLEALSIGDSIANAPHPMFIRAYAFGDCINLEDVIIACKSTTQDRIKKVDIDKVLKDNVYKSLASYGWMFIDKGAFENCGKLKNLSVIDIANRSELSTFCIADENAFSDSPFKKSASYKKIAFVSEDGYYDPTHTLVQNSSSTNSSNSDAHPVKPAYSNSRTNSSNGGAHTSGELPSSAKGWYLLNGGNMIFIIYVGNNKLGQITYINGQEDVEIGTFNYDGNALNVSFGDGVNTPYAISNRNGGWQLNLGSGYYAIKSSENTVSMVYTNPRTLNYIKNNCR